MWHDQKQTAGGYLSRVLSDIAKPFRYRSGPRSLLGVPEKESGKLAFSPALPPVGFRFLDQPFMHESYALPEPLDKSGPPSPINNQETEPERPGAPFQEKIDQNDPVNESKIEIPGVSQKDDFHIKRNTFFENSNILNCLDQQQKSVSGPKEKNIPSQVNKKTKQENFVFEKTNFHAQDVTEKGKKPPSVLPSVKKENILLDKDGIPLSVKNVGGLLEKLEKKDKNEISSLKLKENITNESPSAVENKTSANPDIFTGTSLSILRKKSTAEIQYKQKSPILQKTDNHWHFETAGVDKKFKTDKNIFSEKQNHSSAVIDNRKVPDKLSSPLISGPIGSEAVSGVYAENEINRVRNAVQDSVIRSSARQERQYNDSADHQPEKIQPAPAQQIVIVRQISSHGTRTPRAFWDRSHLGHFYRKILR
ncbi:MAG: hypothetical protein PVG39_03975 [Desulfobacteraceae bacterium]|jgi:hypothetical protein